LRPLLWGLAAGLGVASVVGLLEPALDEGSAAVVVGGLLAGALFLVASRRALDGRDVHVGKLRGAGVRRSMLVLGVLFVHSLPEGFAIGTAFASEREGLGSFILLAIALQNVPAGTAVIAYLLVEQIRALLPFSSRSPRARCSRSSPSSWCRRRSKARGCGAPRSLVRRPAPWRCWR
jgi:zinc transporter ZupT